MKEKENKNKMPRFSLNWMYGIIVCILLYLLLTGNNGGALREVDYSQFEDYVKKGYAAKIVAQKDKRVLEMTVAQEHLKDVFGTDNPKKTGVPPVVTTEYASNDKLMELVDKAREDQAFNGNLSFKQESDLLPNIFWNLFPLLIIVAVWMFIMRRMGGGSPAGGSVFNVGKSKARLIE